MQQLLFFFALGVLIYMESSVIFHMDEWLGWSPNVLAWRIQVTSDAGK
jgi:hypothetical protein